MGDRDREFSEFMAARWQRMVRTCVLLGCSLEDAEDIVQSALVEVYRYWARVVAAHDPDSYAYRIVVNGAKRHLGRASGRAQLLDKMRLARVDQEVATGAEDVVLRRAEFGPLNSLPDDQRRALILRYYAQLSEAQIAEVLQVPHGTVKSRTARGLRALKLQYQAGTILKGER